MIGGITAGIVIFLALVAIGINVVGWIVTSVVLTGLLGWHLPGRIISPFAHILNTLFASAVSLATIMATFFILLGGYNLLPSVNGIISRLSTMI